MKQGTHVGLDKNLKNIRVGDTIKDGDGNEYIINSYGLAVDNFKGGTKKIGDLKNIELVKGFEIKGEDSPSGGAKTEQVKVPAPPLPASEHTATEILDARKETLKSYSDQELAAELRRRGYEVEATKTVIISL